MADVADKIIKSNIPPDDDDIKDISLDRMRWANRRIMSWVFIVATINFTLIILGALIFGSPILGARIIAATELITWLYMGLLTVPSLYFGGTVLERFTGTNKTGTTPT
jgi:hypothetical protein